MEVSEYLDFVGRIKGVEKSSLKQRINYAMEKCAITDVAKKEIGRLSKGYRQRVGLAQAILHNPDVLVLDEPTAGLDPHQIIETRDLIKGLAGNHTIILSTHILPEVEQTCERVVIIARGKLVATDTVENLTSRLRGSETIALEVIPNGAGAEAVRERLLKVSGVAQVILKESKGSIARFTVESEKDRQIRPELARCVFEAGWKLNELHAVGASLEQIFLELTASQDKAAPEASVDAATEEPKEQAVGENQ
jgi:ABC-2 type transport system ATP-binding protein